MDGFEYGFVDLVLDTHGFQGDEQLAVNVPDTAEHRRDTHEVDVGRQLFSPWVDGRLEGVAVWAAVPEQLDHFDLARHRNRNGAAQLYVLFTGFKGLGGEQSCRTGWR